MCQNNIMTPDSNALRAAQQEHMSSNQILTSQQDIACEVLSK